MLENVRCEKFSSRSIGDSQARDTSVHPFCPEKNVSFVSVQDRFAAFGFQFKIDKKPFRLVRDRLDFHRSHCGLKWGEGRRRRSVHFLPSCATHPPLPVSGFSWELCGYPLAERTHERASPRTARRVSNRRARAFEFVQIKKVFVRFLLSRLSLN